MNYLLDSNTLIYLFKGQGTVADHFYNMLPQNMFVPSIVLFELQVGVNKSNNPMRRMRQIKTLLEQIGVLSFGEKEALASAEVRAILEAKGTPIGPYDIQIAGTAIANDLTLVTHNTKEFNRVDGLQITDWF